MSSPFVDPSLAVQDGVYNAISNSSAVTAAFGGKPVNVWVKVPQNFTFPYVVFGESETLEGQFYTGSTTAECHHTVHVYSTSKVECKRITGAIVAALHDTFSLPDGFRVLFANRPDYRDYTEADGLTYHGVIQASWLVG